MLAMRMHAVDADSVPGAVVPKVRAIALDCLGETPSLNECPDQSQKS